jgi:hypothetical protein
MKKALIGGLVGVLVMSCSFHFSIVYLNYIRTLGIGFTPGISILKPDNMNVIRKGMLQAKVN